MLDHRYRICYASERRLLHKLELFQKHTRLQSDRQLCPKRLLAPAIYLIFLAVLWFAAPISELVLAQQASSEVPYRELGTSKFRYLATTLTNLHFTGYTQKAFGYTNGYYYYTFQDGRCILVLLAPDTCKNGQPEIESLYLRARVIRHFDAYEPLTKQLAADLNWTADGIRSQIPDYLLSEPGFHKLLSLLLLGLYFGSGLYALADFLLCLFGLRLP